MKTKSIVPVSEKWRLTLSEAAALCGIGREMLYVLLRKGEFPPRVRAGDDNGGKDQFVAAEVRAWADGRDWRAMVAARTGVVSDAS